MPKYNASWDSSLYVQIGKKELGHFLYVQIGKKELGHFVICTKRKKELGHFFQYGSRTPLGHLVI